MVAAAFVPNPENKKTVDHRYGIKFDNYFENLFWKTQAENNQAAYDLGLKKSGEESYQSKLTNTLKTKKEVMRVTKIERNKKNIERFKTCINTCDKKLAEELIDAKAEFASLISDEKLYGGAGYLSVVEFMRKSFSNISWQIVDMAAEDDKVAVSWICSGTHDGDFMNFPASGKKFSFSCMNFYYFNEDGKIIKDVAAQGMMGLLQSLGLMK